MKKTMVAIFEDDVVNRFIYQRSLERQKENVELHIFDNAQKGIDAARDLPFEVVFIEAHFWKNFGGISILQKLKNILDPSTVYIAITSLLQEGDAETLMGAGFTMCMEKPVAFSDLMFKSKMTH